MRFNAVGNEEKFRDSPRHRARRVAGVAGGSAMIDALFALNRDLQFRPTWSAGTSPKRIWRRQSKGRESHAAARQQPAADGEADIRSIYGI
jgi:hypothetical protein